MKPPMPKHSTIAGPCIQGRQYMPPAVTRLPEARQAAERGQYFAIHAARQPGKATFPQALTGEICAAGRRQALYCPLEAPQGYS
ncbi:MAG: ATP-binding protein, partial [Planctomycetota bacterium]|nr:ATP-binding protein [Planctomycetota bacterium]